MTSEYTIGIDEQSQACKNLWAAVIATAIMDACMKPGKNKAGVYVYRSEALDAIRFLLTESNGIKSMLSLFDIDYEQFRKQLLACMAGDGSLAFGSRIDGSQQRCFRANVIARERIKNGEHLFHQTAGRAKRSRKKTPVAEKS